MLLRMTVVDAHHGSERDVEVRAGSDHTTADLLEALGERRDTVLRVNGAAVAPDSPVGMPPLLDGCVVVLGLAHGAGSARPAAPLRLTTTAGPDSGRSLFLTPGRHVIGRGDTATLRLDDDTLSREHVAVTVDRDGVSVHDLDATNVTLVDDVPVPPEGVPVRVGSRLRAGRTTLLVDTLRPRPSRRRPTGSGTLAVNPTPCLTSSRAAPRITLPREPAAPARRRVPWMMVLLPLPFAALLAFFFGPRMLLFGLLSPVLAIGSAFSDRASARRDHRAAREEWLRERTLAGRRLHSALVAERRDRLRCAPDAAALLDAARGDSTRLWERRRDHAEHPELRLGLARLPAHVEVDRGGGACAHPVLDGAPLVVDLEEVGVLGVAGLRPDRERLARHLMGQLVVLHSHLDVQVSVVAGSEGWWSPFRGLVHLRDDVDVPGSGRVASDDGAAVALLAAHADTVRERVRVGDRSATDDATFTTRVLVVDGVHHWRTDPGLRTVLDRGRGHGVLVIALADTVEELPHECGAVAVLHDGRVSLQVDDTEAATGVVDGVGPAWARRLVAALAPLRDATPAAASAGVPPSARLVDLLEPDPIDPRTIRSEWLAPAATGGTDLDVVVGQGEDGAFRIDLRRDGPHALVAGTTGSGKSEFLVSWVAALAARLSPEQMNFVLVDYKGGAAFAECAHLPHTVGVLTDLDPAQTERALTSLDAELARREKILAESGAKDLDGHRGRPLPRLMIVIDEFRLLAEEQPDALAHLMRIAAVGRSLGVHLVLATQRPGGIVSADIAANVNLRIALRVRDRVDSTDVIGVADAADLPVEAPGRALARTGGSSAQCFQTGRVTGHGPARRESLLVREVGAAWPVPREHADRGPTDLQRLARTLGRVAEDLHLEPPHRPWLPPLPSRIVVDDLPPVDTREGAPFALVDRPDRQQQAPLCWSPDRGHWMVVGGPGSGRTTGLAAIVGAVARTWPRDRVQVQIIGDGSSVTERLAGLPHVGSVIDGGDPSVLRRLLGRLAADVVDRRARLRASGHPTLDHWWSAFDADPTGAPPPPHLLLVIDGWGRLTRPHSGDLGEVADELEAVLRDGTAAGLRGVVAGGRELLSGRISSMVSTRLVLHLPDRGDVAMAGLGGVPTTAGAEGLVPGRARLQPDGLLLQVALPDPVVRCGADDDAVGGRPWRVETLPEEVSVDDLPGASREDLPLGVGGSGRDPVTWRTAGTRRLLVCGGPGSGRTTTLAAIAVQARSAGHPVAVLGEELVDRVGPEIVTGVGPQDRDRLIELRRAHPDLVVVVDDVDRVDDAPVADVVREVLRRVDTDRGLVAAATTTRDAATRVRGLVAEIARARSGVLLQPSSRGDGDALGLRVPPLPGVPGRGYLVTHGRAEEVQIARARG